MTIGTHVREQAQTRRRLETLRDQERRLENEKREAEAAAVEAVLLSKALAKAQALIEAGKLPPQPRPNVFAVAVDLDGASVIRIVR
jgi:hypothetical protein